MEIDRKEILRYLGYHGRQADEAVMTLVEQCLTELTVVVNPRCLYQTFNLSLDEDFTLEFAGIRVKSRNLSKNLAGAERIVVFAATLGVQADMLLKKYSHTQMSKAVIMQAASAAYIEEYCDRIQEKITEEAQKDGFYVRPRFSPGYGDFSIKHQKDILRLLDCQKKIGLTVTESLILAPSKSVTAVMGLSREKQNCPVKGCEECGKKDCLFRRS